jgi:hypothetical protein
VRWQKGKSESDLPGILDYGEEVKMRGQRSDGTKREVMVPLTSSEGAEDNVVDRGSGTEKEPSLDGATGDEDESSRFGEVT